MSIIIYLDWQNGVLWENRVFIIEYTVLHKIIMTIIQE